LTIKVGGTNITDIKIGSTAINSVWVGGTNVWSRLAVTTSPSSGSSQVFIFGPGTATSTVSLTSNLAATFSFSRVSGETSYTTGSTSGTSTFVRITNSQNAGSSLIYKTAVVDVTATVGSASVVTRVTVSAVKGETVSEGGG
jgi:hypothetical protein